MDEPRGRGTRREPRPARAGTFRASSPESGQASPARSAARTAGISGRPEGYDEPVTWAVAEEFLNRIRHDEIPLAWGVPYLYRMFEPGVAATGLLSVRKVLDGDRAQISPEEAGIRLVRYFWTRDPWEYECATGEQVAYRFAEPQSMRSWYLSLVQHWERRRLQKFGVLKFPDGPQHRHPATPRRETS